MAKPKKYPIKARSHVLHLLGDQLIGDDRLAVFELVKNSYDADATEVKVSLELNEEAQRIIVQDDGCGMSLSDITDKWLELGTDSKRGEHSRRTKKYKRMPLGEKGVGRLAAFKLGSDLTLVTKKTKQPEIKVKINWLKLIDSGNYINNLGVEVTEQESPEFFTEKKTGTRIEIRELNRTEWKRGDIRSLYRLVTSLSSPFDTPESFKVLFGAPGNEAAYKDMLRPDDFLEQATWIYTFDIVGENFSWTYRFKPPHWKGVKGYTDSEKNERLQLIPAPGVKKSSKNQKNLLLKAEQLNGIGPINGVIYAYHRRSEVLRESGNQSQLKTWLDDQAGVRVYRDGVRVFNYGEPSDDWLGLNAKRINAPTGRLGTKSVVAAVNLKLQNSSRLSEKTNREGFENNDEYEMFYRIVNSVFEHFGQLHAGDRKDIDAVIKGRAPGEKAPRAGKAIENLRKKLKNLPVFKSIKPDLDAIEDQFNEVRDVMVSAGIAGLNLSVVFHEVERGVDALVVTLEQKQDMKALREQIEHVKALLHTFSPLLKKNIMKNVFASELIDSSIKMRKSRFAYHEIVVSAPILIKEEPDFVVKVPPNLLVGALNNLLDNSIYWTRYRRERDKSGKRAAILVKTYWDEEVRSGFIAVVDNGPGFSIPPVKAIEPFITRRPDGMGLGLYYANLVMEQCGGMLSIHDAADLRDEVEIPKAYDGAAVVLRFGERE